MGCRKGSDLTDFINEQFKILYEDGTITELAEQYGIPWLPTDFKKKGGYQRSIVLSREYDLYRQNFCGCVYSRLEAERREKQEASCED